MFKTLALSGGGIAAITVFAQSVGIGDLLQSVPNMAAAIVIVYLFLKARKDDAKIVDQRHEMFDKTFNRFADVIEKLNSELVSLRRQRERSENRIEQRSNP